jgi:nitrite reductase/ring-hydroxylating ferredoxin subunit
VILSQQNLPDHGEPSACAGCQLMERRSFLLRASAALAGIAATLGVAPGLLEGMTVRLGRAQRRSGEEHAYPLPAEDGATIDHEAEIILVRFQQKAYAFNLSCPHQHTALKWHPEDNQFQCPKHHSRYTPDGTFVSGRATRGMDRFGLRHEGDQIIVNVSQYYRQDQNRAEWEAAVVSL